MKEQLISFETAKLAKEKEFKELTNNFFSTHNKEGNKHRTSYQIYNENWNNYKKGYITNKLEILYSRPTQSLLQKWLREKYNIHVEPYPILLTKNEFEQEVMLFSDFDYAYKIINKGITKWISLDNMEYNSYEEALEAGLLEGLKLIKT